MFVDADESEAEDIVGQLGIDLHAGFQPYSAQKPSSYLLKQSGEIGNSLCRPLQVPARGTYRY